ncbi:MAG: arsenite methyltransferase [Asgard group archaeon]|nr:arsenite methyltransferase [Asgard group archaeon]
MSKKTERRITSCGCSKDELDDTSIENEQEKARRHVRDQYKSIAKGEPIELPEEAKDIEPGPANYSKDELSSIPDGSNMGLGSGNPTSLADVQPGEVVIDLGSGPGVDCFLAANKVGETGKVIGIDMTYEMIDRARDNALKGNYNNVEFRLGEIEHLPVADNSADLIISNCVINLAPDKSQVFREAFRVLKPGGRLIISDIMFGNEMPQKVRDAFKGSYGCVSSAVLMDEYLSMIEKAGFSNVEILDKHVIKGERREEHKGSKTDEEPKIQIIADGKKVELDLTPEELKVMETAFLRAHVKAIKPN